MNIIIRGSRDLCHGEQVPPRLLCLHLLPGTIQVNCYGLFINDVSFFIDLHSIEYTLFYSVQVYKKADVIYEQPLMGSPDSMS